MRKTLLRTLLSFVAALSVSSSAIAQEHKNRLFHTPEFVEPPGFAVGMNIGLTDLWGDIGTKSSIDHYNNEKYWNSPKFMGGLYVRYTPHPALGLRLGVNYGTLYSSDNFNLTKAKKAGSIEDDAYQRYLRNLNVKTNVWEGNLLFEINPYRIGNLEGKLAKKHFQPYALLGIGGFHFRPKAEFTDLSSGRKQWIDVSKLHLEGEGFNYPDAPKEYSLWQMNIPLGLGVRWDIGRQLGLGLEYMYRYTFTDYLDGVSDRYIDPALYDANLSPKDAATAKALADKSYLINKDTKHAPGELRGNKAVKDGYSTISLTFFYKVKSRKTPWWY